MLQIRSARATTTASGRGSCSRSATRAGGCRGSARGRCCPTRSRSTSTRPRASCTRSAGPCTGSSGRGRRSSRAGRALVVEGYTDVIACHQAGIADAVAIMGTAITPEQVKLLSGATRRRRCWRSTRTAPGARRCCARRRCGGKRLRLRVARMPEGKDPADLLAGGDGGERERVPGGDRGGGGAAGVPRARAARRRRPGARRRAATGRSTRWSR